MSIEDEICKALRLEQIFRRPKYGHFDHESNYDIGPDEVYSDSNQTKSLEKKHRQEVYLKPVTEGE